MNLTWLAFVPISRTAQGYFSPVASVRYRLLVPLRELESAGHRVQLLEVQPQDAPEALAARLTGEVVIFSKVMYGEDFHAASQRLLQLVAAAQRDRRKVVVDVCDDHFGLPVYGDFLKTLASRADLVVAASGHLAEAVSARCSRSAHVVADPYEGSCGEPRFAPPRPQPRSLLGRLIGRAPTRALKLLWFGHESNFPAVVEFIPRLERLIPRYRLELELVTAAESGAPALCARFNERHAPVCTLRFTPWSIDALRSAFEECDLVIIPTLLEDPAKLARGSNRLVQSLWSGRFAIAHPVASYRELDAWSWIGGDLVDGVEWALAHPREVRRRIADAQHYVQARHAPPVIALQWETAIKAALGDARIPPHPAQYSRTNPSPRYAQLQELYRAMHEQGEAFLEIPPEKIFPGSSLLPQAGRIRKLVERTGAHSVLDYGSGKGYQYRVPAFEDESGRNWAGVAAYWGVESVACYDPGYAPFSRFPEGRFDGVISTDVLEHCPEEDIPWIVEEMFALASRFVFASVACYPASKRLPNGENAHCTVKPDAWWRELFEAAAARHAGLVWEVWVDTRVATEQGPHRIEGRFGNT